MKKKIWKDAFQKPKRITEYSWHILYRLLSISMTNPNYNFLPEQEPVTMQSYSCYKWKKGALESVVTSTVLETHIFRYVV